MKHVMLPVAFVGGAVVYWVAGIYVGGIAAAVPVSASYFDTFGLAHRQLALALVDLVVNALPIATTALLAAALVLYPFRGQSAASWSVLGGMLFGYLLVRAAFGFVGGELVWWGIPHFLAPGVGAVGAIWSMKRTGYR